MIIYIMDIINYVIIVHISNYNGTGAVKSTSIKAESEKRGEPRNRVPEEGFQKWGRFDKDFMHKCLENMWKRLT